MIRDVLKNRIVLLREPSAGVKREMARDFEGSLYEYLIFLIAIGILAAVVSFIASVAKSVYYDVFYSADIQYMNMLNYAVGRANGLLFFYLFAGTFMLFAVSLLLHWFVKARYVRLLQLIFASLTPVLLFGFLPSLALAFLAWSLVILLSNVSLARETGNAKRGSIKQRD